MVYVRIWTGLCYISFAADPYSRLIPGWQTSRSLRTDPALDALEMALGGRKGDVEGQGANGSPLKRGRFIRLEKRGALQLRQRSNKHNATNQYRMWTNTY